MFFKGNTGWGSGRGGGGGGGRGGGWGGVETHRAERLLAFPG